MQDRFDKAVSRLVSRQDGCKVLLAVSGGVDSMTMASLFMHSALRLPFAVAHFNFHLRGEESDSDEALVAAFCERCSVEFFRCEADTRAFAASEGLSLEMAARQLRYEWFASLCRDKGFTQLAVAHNLDDNAETLLLHLLRGTGLRGLAGIREDAPLPGAEGARIIRPLLGFSRKEIESYAVREGVEFHIDSTNSDISIARNRIRHEVFPQLAAVNPSFLRTFEAEMKRFGQMEQLLDKVFEAGKGDICKEVDSALCIDVPALLAKGQTSWWLYKLLDGCGFNAARLEQIEASLHAQSGKEFISPTHRLVKDRRELRVYPLPEAGADDLSARLDVRTFAVTPIFDPRQKPDDVLFVDAALLRLPLSARPPREGDRFRPFGMHRGSKLLSDFFTGLKLDVEQKRREIVVTMQDKNGDEVIVAILGRRIDDRFKVTDRSKTVAAISLLPLQE